MITDEVGTKLLLYEFPKVLYVHIELPPLRRGFFLPSGLTFTGI